MSLRLQPHRNTITNWLAIGFLTLAFFVVITPKTALAAAAIDCETDGLTLVCSGSGYNVQESVVLCFASELSTFCPEGVPEDEFACNGSFENNGWDSPCSIVGGVFNDCRATFSEGDYYILAVGQDYSERSCLISEPINISESETPVSMVGFIGDTGDYLTTFEDAAKDVAPYAVALVGIWCVVGMALALIERAEKQLIKKFK